MMLMSAFVAVPVILGVFLVYLLHEVVAVGLGQNRGRRDAHHLAVALDDGLVGNGFAARGVLVGVEAVAVHQDVFGARGELIQSAMHRQNGGAQDVDLVDLFVVHDADGPGQSLTLDDGTQFVAHALRELLRVVETLQFARGDVEIGRQDDGGREDGSGQTSASGFVASGLESSLYHRLLQHVRTSIERDGRRPRGRRLLRGCCRGQKRRGRCLRCRDDA